MNYRTSIIAQALYATAEGGIRSDAYAEPWSKLTYAERAYWEGRARAFIATLETIERLGGGA